MVARTTRLGNWVHSVLKEPDSTKVPLIPVSGDASFRRYYRVQTDDSSYIAVDAPPDREKNRQFVELARLLRHNQLHVPLVHQADFEHGFLLLSDLGDNLYYSTLLLLDSQDDRVDQLYQSAIKCLINMQKIDYSACDVPEFDADFISRELALFPDWFIAGQLGVEEYTDYGAVADLLIVNALEQPQIFMHRDFHSKNLMITGNEDPGVLDFQDAVIGPITYDLASLLKDCYLRWSDAQITRWIQTYIDLATDAGILSMVDSDQFERWFDLMALQRHLKCAGIFARLYKRDGKKNYLQDIPRVIAYIMETTSKYQELGSFNHWLTRSVVPAMDKMGDFFGNDIMAKNR